MHSRVIPPGSKWRRAHTKSQGVAYTVQSVGGGVVELESDAGDRESIDVRRFFRLWEKATESEQE